MTTLLAIQADRQPMDETKLARDAIANSDAFAELYSRHVTRVYRYHMAHTGNMKDAEDLTSQTFMSALEGIKSFHGTGSFAAWIMGIASKKKLMFFRGRKPEFPLDEAIRLQSPNLPTDKQATRRLELESVSRALRRLSRDRAEALILSFFRRTVEHRNQPRAEQERSRGQDADLSRIARPARPYLSCIGGGTMNDKIKNAKHDELANKLMDIAQHANADPHFVADLEDKLTMTHKTKQNGTTPSFRSMIPSLGWVGFVIAFGFVLNWSIRNLIPAPQPASGGVIFNEATLTLTAELAVQESATSIPDDRSYDWRGTKLYLAQPLPDTPVEANIYVLNSDQYESVSQKRRFGNDGIIMEGQPVEYDLVGTYEILSAEDAFQKILSPDRPAGLLEIFIGKGGGGGGGVGFYKLNLTGNPVIFPTTTPTTQPYPTPQINDLPTATIEVVMLNYYVRDPSSERWHPLYDIYIQPIWRFAGHYNNGDEFEFLVQALKEVYLLPELAPYTPPG